MPGTCVQIGVPEALELLLDSALNPRLATFEVEGIAKRLEADITAFQQNDMHGRLLEARTLCFSPFSSFTLHVFYSNGNL